MKTFLLLDFKIQMWGFVLLITLFSIFSLIREELINFIIAFLWISILQLISMLIRFVLNCKKGALFYGYLLFSLLFWMYFLYEKSKFKFSYSLESIWILLSIYSGFVYYFFSIFYLVYCYETYKSQN